MGADILHSPVSPPQGLQPRTPRTRAQHPTGAALPPSRDTFQHTSGRKKPSTTPTHIQNPSPHAPTHRPEGPAGRRCGGITPERGGHHHHPFHHPFRFLQLRPGGFPALRDEPPLPSATCRCGVGSVWG